MRVRWILPAVIGFSTVVLAQGQQGQGQGQTGRAGQAGQAQQGQQQGRGARGGGAGQNPARDTQQQQAAVTGTGVITGVVTSGGGSTSAPVRRARITLSGELRGGRSTVTNDQGQFTFSALPAGRFTMTASKAGYVDMPYGAKRPGRPGTPIQLAAGQKMEGANITLPKGGVITGVVVDDSGEPAPGTQVRVLRYVMRTGEKTLQQAGQGQADDRGIYRIYGLQPGDYLVSAVPRNQSLNDLRGSIAAEIENAMQQLQASGIQIGGGRGGGPGGLGGGGRALAGAAGIDLGQLMNGRGGANNPDLAARVNQLQQQLAQTEQEQAVAYAPVYYPGTASPAQSSPVSIGISEEHAGVDFRLVLVQTAKVEGTVQSQDGVMPQNTQIQLVPMDQIGMPAIPGASTSMTRARQDGHFEFTNVPPGQYRVMARANIRAVDPTQTATADPNAGRGGRGGGRGADFGPGGRGGAGIAQVLWGSSDINVVGQNIQDVSVQLQAGMTITGHITFEASTLLPPTDLTRVRINVQPRGAQQGMEMGGVPPAQVDATGRFTITGVAPGRYSINANAAAATAPGLGGGGGGGGRGGAAAAGNANAGAAQWVLKSATAGGQDVLDFGLTVEPRQDVSNMTLSFVDRNQEISGTIQDTTGKPTADYTIILFASEKTYWLPQSRRIQSARPSTDGKFTFRNIPAGDYRLTAVTDVEPGEWYDPNFLGQLVNVSIPVGLKEGEKKVQDIKVAGGGH